MEATFQSCIQEVRAEGRTVLLSSHILAEAEALCDRVSIIRKGRTVQSGTLSDLRHLTRTSISAETVHPVAGLADLPGVHHLHTDDGRVDFEVDNDHLDGAIRFLTTAGLRSLTSAPPTLEELFLRQYGDELAAAGDTDLAGARP
jgi:ABC-2 type transport system ATP-binding protein